MSQRSSSTGADTSKARRSAMTSETFVAISGANF